MVTKRRNWYFIFRYFGLTKFYVTDASDHRKFDWVTMEWASYVNPLALLWLYYVLVLEARFLLKPQVLIFAFYRTIIEFASY